MSTQKSLRRQAEEVKDLVGFPPEGLREPFKPIDPDYSQRFPFGTGGENRAVPADELDPDQAYTLENVKINLKDIEPAWGYTAVGSMAANDTPLEINTYKQVDGSPQYLVVIDEDDLNYYDGSNWAAATGTLTGAATDKIRSAMVLDEFVFVNDVDEPKTWTGGATFVNLSADANRPTRAKFVAAFAERVVFGSVDGDTQRLEWSQNGDIDDFTNTGAGGTNLYDAQADAYADAIQGLHVFGNFLVVPRSRSWWIGVRTGDVTAPLNFAPHVIGNGVMAPDSVAVCGGAGIAYLGHDNVYLYHPQNAEPIPIGTPIRDRLFAVLDLSKLNKVRCAFVPETQEYWLLIPDTTNTWGRRSFVFSLRKFQLEQRFVWYERLLSHDISAMGSGQTSGLGASPGERAKSLLLANSSGANLYDSDSADTTDAGSAFTCSFWSPQYVLGQSNIQLTNLNIAYRAGSTTDVTVSYSVDGGSTFTNSAVYTLASTNEIREVGLWVPPGVYGRSCMFQLTMTGAQNCNLVGYRLGYLNRGPIFGV